MDIQFTDWRNGSVETIEEDGRIRIVSGDEVFEGVAHAPHGLSQGTPVRFRVSADVGACQVVALFAGED